jgi:hypothetical protein
VCPTTKKQINVVFTVQFKFLNTMSMKSCVLDFRQLLKHQLKHQLLKHQLGLLRKVALTGPDHVMRKDTFIDSMVIPQIGRLVRRVGRPRQDWTTHFLRERRELFGWTKFHTYFTDCSDGADIRWKMEVDSVIG